MALAGFLHETNTFAPSLADMSSFVQGGGYMPMARGAALMEAGRGINLGIGGAVEHGEAAGLEWAGRWTTFTEAVHFQLPNWRQRILEG